MGLAAFERLLISERTRPGPREPKAFLGEFAAGDEMSLEALQDLCRTPEANTDVWIGWAAWAGGTWWPGTICSTLSLCAAAGSALDHVC